MPTTFEHQQRQYPRDERPRVFLVLVVGRRERAEHRRQHHRAHEVFSERRRGDMERVAAAGGEAHQHELGVRVLGAHHGDEVGQVVVEFAGIVDVAARAGVAMAANVGRVDRNAGGAERLAERMDARALRRGAMDGDDDESASGDWVRRPDAVRDRRAVARSKLLRLRQIAEIDVPERRAERGEQLRRLAGAESEHAGRARRQSRPPARTRR